MDINPPIALICELVIKIIGNQNGWHNANFLKRNIERRWNSTNIIFWTYITDIGHSVRISEHKSSKSIIFIRFSYEHKFHWGILGQSPNIVNPRYGANAGDVVLFFAAITRFIKKSSNLQRIIYGFAII